MMNVPLLRFMFEIVRRISELVLTAAYKKYY